mmetsp:Transcript_21894/g.28069  ORF Transcript_21894/g.28069 Transcript_21894/m.28069 type:complete len:149 (-) Transcript_21894:1089-1535(-)
MLTFKRIRRSRRRRVRVLLNPNLIRTLDAGRNPRTFGRWVVQRAPVIKPLMPMVVLLRKRKKETTPSERDDSNAGKDGDKENNKREEITEPQKLELPGQGNQFAFDDDIMIGGDIDALGGIGKKKIRTRARKGISLDEYQERKTAGTL